MSSLSPLAYVIIVLTFFGDVHTQDKSTKNTKASVMLLRMVPRNEQQLSLLKSLKYERHGLRMQLWRHPDKINQYVDVWLSELSIKKFTDISSSVDLKFKILSKDILKEIGKPDISMNNIENYDRGYQTIDDIVAELKRLSTIYKDNLSIDVIGKSGEGRDLYTAHIHKNASVSKPIVFVLCGSHSREWLGIAACQFVLRKLLFDQQFDVEIKGLLNEYDVVMVPVLNPDGYAYTLTSRMWRKSRSKTSDNRCRGVDINRNFDYRWGGGGSSADPCEEIYCGSKPFSESESLALARYLYKIRRKIMSFFDVHTYGQLWMSPWGFTKGFPRDYARQETALKSIQKAIKETNGITYKIGRSATTLSKTSGTAIDWVYGRLNVIHSYGTELRPANTVRYNGFQESPEEIIPTGKDLIMGIKSLSHLIISEKNKRI